MGDTEGQYNAAASAVAETGQFIDGAVAESTKITDPKIIRNIRNEMVRRGELKKEGPRFLPVDPRTIAKLPKGVGPTGVYYRAKIQKRDGTTGEGRPRFPTRAQAVASAQRDLERHQQPIQKGNPGGGVTRQDIDDEYDALVALRNERNRAAAEQRVVPKVYSPDYRNLTMDEELVVNTSPMFVARDAQGVSQSARRPLRTREGRAVNPFNREEKAQLKNAGIAVSSAPETISMVEENFFDEEGRLQSTEIIKTPDRETS